MIKHIKNVFYLSTVCLNIHKHMKRIASSILFLNLALIGCITLSCCDKNRSFPNRDYINEFNLLPETCSIMSAGLFSTSYPMSYRESPYALEYLSNDDYLAHESDLSSFVSLKENDFAFFDNYYLFFYVTTIGTPQSGSFEGTDTMFEFVGIQKNNDTIVTYIQVPPPDGKGRADVTYYMIQLFWIKIDVLYGIKYLESYIFDTGDNGLETNPNFANNIPSKTQIVQM